MEIITKVFSAILKLIESFFVSFGIDTDRLDEVFGKFEDVKGDLTEDAE